MAVAGRELILAAGELAINAGYGLSVQEDIVDSALLVGDRSAGAFVRVRTGTTSADVAVLAKDLRTFLVATLRCAVVCGVCLTSAPLVMTDTRLTLGTEVIVIATHSVSVWCVTCQSGQEAQTSHVRYTERLVVDTEEFFVLAAPAIVAVPAVFIFRASWGCRRWRSHDRRRHCIGRSPIGKGIYKVTGGHYNRAKGGRC